MSAGLDARLAALAEAVELADGRLDAAAVDRARAVVRRAGERLGLGVEATVVALAGPTGAGKSTLFNALAGAELVPAGVRRPTTSSATAAVWGDVGAPLLDWLEVPRRHVVADGDRPALVVLDLPDFDSVEAAHRVEVDRMVELVDLMVWVVDPQKYADGSLHEHYLRPLAGHREAMLVALNQADRLDAAAQEACRADLARLLAGDGLDGVPVLAVSAVSGEGLGALREELERRVARRRAAVTRLAADVGAAAGALAPACAGKGGRGVGRRERERLDAALGEAAGARTVVGAVERAHRRRGTLATGWPFARWALRLRPDPLRRLRLGDGEPDSAERTSLPPATPVQRAQVDSAVRELAAAASAGMADPWPARARTAATAQDEALPGRLDRAVAGARIAPRAPRWWAAARALQALLAVCVLAGALWLLVLAVLGWLRIEDVLPVPEIRGIPVPTGLLLGGAALGLLLAVLARVVNGAGARRRGRKAERALRGAVGEVAQEAVVAPVEAELAARERLCRAVGTAAG